jgi:DNA-directed RNA polymerase specialized sigma24 family protein
MSYKGSSLRTLDLFEDMPPAPGPASGSAKLPALSGQSDARLARLLEDLMGELQRRMETGGRPKLERAVRDASLSLERLLPRSGKPDRRPRSMNTQSSLQEGQRKAIRAALLAGVAPGQIAKHFGLSLAAVRKVLDEAA